MSHAHTNKPDLQRDHLDHEQQDTQSPPFPPYLLELLSTISSRSLSCLATWPPDGRLIHGHAVDFCVYPEIDICGIGDLWKGIG